MSDERESQDVLEPGRRAAEQDSSNGEKKEKEKETVTLKETAPVRRRHEITVGGKQLAYWTTAGMMPLKNDKGEIQAQIFFMAYTLDAGDGEHGDSSRPLTFAFNGGPGSSSIWLHMGALGPKRVHLKEDGSLPPPPFRLVDNDETWLTETDLVFIDPVGTGFSRAKSEEQAQQYWGYNGDIESVGEFIRLYLTRYGRWTSPLFLAGESYGTIRASGLAGHLIDKGIAFSGIMLISATMSYLTLASGDYRGLDLPYALYLPSFTATAWYHGKLDDDLQRRPLAEVVAEAEAWALSDYLVALAKGDAVPDQERREIAAHVARYTGLSPEYVDGSRLRVHIWRFCKELLRDVRQTVGRIDSRFTGVDDLAVTDSPDFDPSLSNAAWAAVFNHYIRRELGYETDDEYEILSMKVNEKWKFDQARMGFVSTSDALRKAFARNPYMRVLVAWGYYDLATPYLGIVYNVNHMGLEQPWRDNVRWEGYESGHMMYINRPDREKFKRDVAGFIADALRS
jgi:carboxypeptidase C (cathepsin A)